MPKVHITLIRETVASPARVHSALARIEALSGITGVNERRLYRYGILSGEVPQDSIEELRTLDEVKSVTVDSLQRAL